MFTVIHAQGSIPARSAREAESMARYFAWKHNAPARVTSAEFEDEIYHP